MGFRESLGNLFGGDKAKTPKNDPMASFSRAAGKERQQALAEEPGRTESAGEYLAGGHAGAAEQVENAHAAAEEAS